MKRFLKALYAALPFKQQVFTLLRPLRPPEPLFRHLHFQGVVTVPVSSTEAFRIHHWGSLLSKLAAIRPADPAISWVLVIRFPPPTPTARGWLRPGSVDHGLWCGKARPCRHEERERLA